VKPRRAHRLSGMRVRAAAYHYEMPRAPSWPGVLLVQALACGRVPVSAEPAAQPAPSGKIAPGVSPYDAAPMHAADSGDGGDGAADGATMVPLDPRTWRTHPSIVAVRALVQAVDHAITQKTLRVVRREYDCLPG